MSRLCNLFSCNDAAFGKDRQSLSISKNSSLYGIRLFNIILIQHSASLINSILLPKVYTSRFPCGPFIRGFTTPILCSLAIFHTRYPLVHFSFHNTKRLITRAELQIIRRFSVSWCSTSVFQFCVLCLPRQFPTCIHNPVG